MAAGSVLWILAMVDGAQQAKAAGEGFSLSAILSMCQPSSSIVPVRYTHDKLPELEIGADLVDTDCKTSGKAGCQNHCCMTAKESYQLTGAMHILFG